VDVFHGLLEFTDTFQVILTLCTLFCFYSVPRGVAYVVLGYTRFEQFRDVLNPPGD